jgi:hypothetical protein
MTGFEPPKAIEEVEEEEGDDDDRLIRLPIPIMMSRPDVPILDTKWVKHFTRLVTAEDDGNERIIFLTGVIGMSETFDAWWPSLLQAVRRRNAPTTIVLSCAPSMQAVDDRTWWSCRENDEAGRDRKSKTRLSAIGQGYVTNDGADHRPMSMLPSFSAKKARHPILDMLQGKARTESPVSKAMLLIPDRDMKREKSCRIRQRRTITVALVSRAVTNLEGTLKAPMGALEEEGPWDDEPISWAQAEDMASLALAGRTSITWADVLEAHTLETAETSRLSDLFDPSAATIDVSKQDLSVYEKRLLPCLVAQQPTSFSDVHLPYKTIDGIRTMVSLPLLFPDAFRGGVLGSHTTTGALLFGPPGTGKTLLARAVASESGARMLSVQVNECRMR